MKSVRVSAKVDAARNCNRSLAIENKAIRSQPSTLGQKVVDLALRRSPSRYSCAP
jgi:hypothetical protein